MKRGCDLRRDHALLLFTLSLLLMRWPVRRTDAKRGKRLREQASLPQAAERRVRARDDVIAHAALRALAFKWIRIIFRCWHERTPYDEAQYLEALRQRGSTLAWRLKLAPAPDSSVPGNDKTPRSG